ncbi:MAG: hypothetical protein MK132_17635 [Lentisphaerales bacterium]|nr:hypothetical protein [Lentisphaerales bacterium]
MTKRIVVIFLLLSIVVDAKIDMSQFKDSVKFGDQSVSIDKAEIIINKMPGIGSAKPSKYIVVTLKTSDGKKIKAPYKIVSLSFPGYTRRFTQKVTESRGDGCVVRELPEWAGKGILVALTIEDSSGKQTKIRSTTTVLKVH